jgi:2-polyprenyl-3-methyl-5-hydroxy-6-metoxy-1,4-benzoquinol methylase
MTRLTEKNYWEGIYKDVVPIAQTLPPDSFSKRWLKRVMGRRLLDLITPYDDYLLWKSVFPDNLPGCCKGLSVVEIGSAPGEFLVRFATTFGADPYGVEYSRHGAELNRQTFEANGFNPENVIEADFFSQQFLDAYRGFFDIVVSRGFIEHFVDVESVVSRHVELLRPGGLLFVMIPNLRGVYYPWTKAFNPEQLPIHNLELMNISCFSGVFEKQSLLDMLRCSYFGTFSFWMFTARNDAIWINRLIRLLLLLQRGLNVLFRFAFSRRGCESAMFSPNLLFVGRKKNNEN